MEQKAAEPSLPHTQRLSFHGLPGRRSCGALSKSEIAFMAGDQVSAVKLHEMAKAERQVLNSWSKTSRQLTGKTARLLGKGFKCNWFYGANIWDLATTKSRVLRISELEKRQLWVYFYKRAYIHLLFRHWMPIKWQTEKWPSWFLWFFFFFKNRSKRKIMWTWTWGENHNSSSGLSSNE